MPFERTITFSRLLVLVRLGVRVRPRRAPAPSACPPRPRSSSPSSRPGGPASWRKTAPFSLRISKALRPEVQAQDVAFPRQQVVVDVHPRHRLQVAADDAVGDEGGRSRPPRSRRARWRAACRAGAGAAPCRPRTTRRPARRGPSSSSRTASCRRSRGRRPGPCARARGSRRRRPRPARRCRRCSSGPRPGRRGSAGRRTSVSPSAELRRWPMCAALFGLMAVCSTIVLTARAPAPGPRAACFAAGAAPARSRRNAARSRNRFRYPWSPPRGRRPGPSPSAAAISSAISFGALRSAAGELERQRQRRGRPVRAWAGNRSRSAGTRRRRGRSRRPRAAVMRSRTKSWTGRIMALDDVESAGVMPSACDGRCSNRGCQRAVQSSVRAREPVGALPDRAGVLTLKNSRPSGSYAASVVRAQSRGRALRRGGPDDLQAARLDLPRGSVSAARRAYTAQSGWQAVARARHHGVVARARPARRGCASSGAVRNGRSQATTRTCVAGGLDQRRVDAARARRRRAAGPGTHSQARIGRRARVAGHDEDPVGDAVERGELAFEDRRPADAQRALVARRRTGGPGLPQGLPRPLAFLP